ncbi:MAG: sugar phosphate isomerase/epimerase [Chitinophagaceae bacterium]
MTTRLAFIKNSSLIAAGFMLEPSAFWLSTNKVGLGLYTLRNELSKDLNGTLSQVAKIGYKDVETFGYNGKYWGKSPAELASLLKSMGLISTSGHYFSAESFLENGWENKWKAAIQDAATLGQKYVVVPFLGESFRTIENYKKLAGFFNKAAQLCKQSKMNFVYHNHSFEFDNVKGESGFEILMKTDKAVSFEMDIYWVSFAGKDPVALMKAHPGRFPLWHVKDMDKTPKKYFTEVGNGVIDFKKIFAHAKLAGMKHFYVEQDMSPGSPFDSIQKSIGYLKKNIVK